MGNYRRIQLLGLIACIVLLQSTAAAERRKTRTKVRYVVYSAEAKTSTPVRHDFGEFFSTNISRRNARALRNKGIAVQRVGKSTLLKPPGACSPWPACKGGGDPTPTPTPEPSPTPTPEPSPSPTPEPGGRAYVPNDQTPWGIEAIYNNNSIATTSGGNATVAILDSGIDTDHPDLVGVIAGCVDFTGGGKNPIKVGRCEDTDGHGSHVAGTIGADGGADGLGIYGVAPDTAILAYKVCKPSGCWNDDIAAAINYASSRADIVSMSLGADGESSLIANAISNNPNLLYVAAAGNDGPGIGSIDFPGANVNVIAVAALSTPTAVASFSSRGVNNTDGSIGFREVELAAPGVNVESTIPGGAYAHYSGTSMATPHISGLASKLWQGSAASTRAYLQSLAAANDIDAAGEDPASGLGFPRVP